MADLRTDSAGMQELLAHLLEREGAFDYFYCDDRGLVTIAVGFLVDADGKPEATALGVATKLASRADVKFTTREGAAASVGEVETDWRRVKEHGHRNPGVGARQYAQVAQLRIDRASIDAITGSKISMFLDALYERRAFILDLDVHVAMALVDARYNPAGVGLYGSEPEIQEMWSALDPTPAQHNPSRAVQLFEQLWAGRGGPRYQQRHQQRIAWMRAGLKLPPGAAIA